MVARANRQFLRAGARHDIDVRGHGILEALTGAKSEDRSESANGQDDCGTWHSERG